MDSLSQAVLGGMVGVLVTRGKHPRKAILYGAVLATVPDLDVLQPFDNDLEATTKHRTWSHSWLVHLLVSPLIGTILHQFNRHWTCVTWITLVFLVFTSHAALDALTIYGTGLFWPVATKPVMGGSVFIIDPLFTLPLLIATVFVLHRPTHPRLLRSVALGVVLSSLYLGWGLVAQYHVEKLAVQSMAEKGENWLEMVATPTPFNSVLWRVLVLQDDHFFEGFYSFTDSSKNIKLHRYPRNLHLIDRLSDRSHIDSFANFNHGYFSLSGLGDQIIANDLRMGAEPYYFFRFVLAEESDTAENSGRPTAHSPGALIPRFANIPIDEWRFFSWMGKRLVSSNLDPIGQFTHLDAVAAPKADGI